jgi:DNA-binding CsgD family transcriptional regulator
MHHDRERAERCLTETEAYCREHDLGAFLLLARGHAALHMVHRGDWAGALLAAEEILAYPGLSPLHRINPLVTLALVRARRGEAEAWPLLDQALNCGEPSDLFRLGIVWAARAEAAWLAGDDAAVITQAQHGLKAATLDSDPWLVGPLLRWIAVAGGQPPALPAAEPYALELAGDWRAAAAAWTELGCPYEAALAQLGEADPRAARTALSTLDALGAHAAAERAHTRLRQLGHRRTRFGRADPYGLTAREAEVLALLREHLTDSQIAVRLHIAPKTVSHHVGAILIKLDVKTRREAAAHTANRQPNQ